MKWCAKCAQEQPLEAFGNNAAQPDGKAAYCKACFRKVHREQRERKAEAAGRVLKVPRAAGPAGTKWCPDCAQFLLTEEFVRNRTTSDGLGGYCRPHQNARAKRSVEKNHGTTRHYHLRRRYGVGAHEVADIIARQAGLCPICIRPLGARPHVDHDHVTGEVRGVLCFTCNGGLGNYGDDAARLRRAADYLDGTLTAPSRIAPGVYDVADLGWRRTVAAEGRPTSE